MNGRSRKHGKPAISELSRLQDVFGNTEGEPLGGFPDCVAVKMRMARGRLDLAVTGQPADE